MPTPISLIVALILFARGDFDFSCPCGEVETPAPTATAHVDRLLPDILKITRANAFASLKPSAKQYTVECRWIFSYKPSAKESRRSGTPLAGEAVLAAPTITVGDGEMVTMQTVSTRTFVIARTGNGIVPVTREVWEGTKYEICVVGANDGKAVVDVEMIGQSTNGASDDAHSIQVHNVTRRMIECVSLGETTTSSFEEGKMEVVVKEARE